MTLSGLVSLSNVQHSAVELDINQVKAKSQQVTIRGCMV